MNVRSLVWSWLVFACMACSSLGKEEVQADTATPDLRTLDIVTPDNRGGESETITGKDGTTPDITDAVVEADADDITEIIPDQTETLEEVDQGCTPNCDGKECGDDGCGGECGECPEHAICSNSLCECEVLTCGETCCPDGANCLDQACCTPDCDGKQCGPDGCGGECGTCAEGEVCLEEQTCCIPDCDGKECGFDGCGGECGDCLPDGICLQDQCCFPDCDGKMCGDDGCDSQCGFCGVSELCINDQCLPDPQFVGCSDGTREGFMIIDDYPLLAACGGAWDIPGIHGTIPACSQEAGNTGVNPMGTGCNVADLCAQGWHVCLGKNDVDYRSPLGCLEIMKGAQSPAFFMTRTSSSGAFNCEPDDIGNMDNNVNDIFGCGDLGCPANEASCEPLQLGSHDLCKSIKVKPGCNCHFPGELEPGHPKYVQGDFENAFCEPQSGGCGWCKPINYWNKKLGLDQVSTWDCGSNTTQEANNVTKSDPHIQGGVLCCKDQCAIDADCDDGMVCLMSTCQLP